MQRELTAPFFQFLLPPSNVQSLTFFFFFPVLGFEWAYTLNHTSPPVIFLGGSVLSRKDLTNYLPGLNSNYSLPDLCLLSS
jgi:hypothetical protein